MTTKQSVLFFVLLYFLIRLPWVFTLPITEAPDEPNHFWVVQYIAQHWQLPTFEAVNQAGPAAEYGALPPLGYIPHVILTALAPENLASLFSRFASLIIGSLVPWMAVLLGKELFPYQRVHARALPLLVVVHPQLVFVNSYTNNDSMATAIASVLIYLLVGCIKNGITTRKAAIAGALFGLLGLCKHTGLSVAPAVLAAIVLAGYANALPLTRILLRLSVFASMFVTASGWFFLRNYFEFKGDILGTKTMYELWIKILPTVNGKVQHPWPPAHQIGWWRYVFFDYVGLFGYMDRYLWRPIYFVYLAYGIAAIAGWLKGLKRMAPLQKMDVETKKEFCVWVMIAAFPLCNLLANLAATIVNVTGPHGRYLFPSELCILALTIAGLRYLRAGQPLVISLIVINLLVTVWVWICWYMPVPH